RFIELTATNPAKIFGLYPQKGTIAVGSDADIAIWDSEREVVIRSENIHDNAGYTPYEGWTVVGWPLTVLSRGRVVVHQNELRAERGSGRFIVRKSLEAAVPLENPSATALLARRFGANDVI
ncbi:MAG: amidohydrolase family protein, partial [Acidobacteria bacterium]|nr:amidohydrolase family protein [Acidobacteriota bacterium]